MRVPLNITNHPPHDLITIAHRGGVVGEGVHENSLLAIHRAIERGYDMVEIDIMPTADGFPVLVHGAWYEWERGADRPKWEITFDDKTLAEARGIHHPWNGETVMTLDEGLDLCKGKLGVMLDIKVGDAQPVFYERIADAIDTHGFADKTVTISNDYEAVRKTLEGRALFAVPSTKRLEEMRTSGEPLSKHYVFQVPDPIPGEPLESSPDLPVLSERDVQTFHAAGLPVIVAVNTFRYSCYPDAEKRHMELARRDINRFRAAGVDGFQIDSCYQDFVF